MIRRFRSFLLNYFRTFSIKDALGLSISIAVLYYLNCYIGNDISKAYEIYKNKRSAMYSEINNNSKTITKYYDNLQKTKSSYLDHEQPLYDGYDITDAELADSNDKKLEREQIVIKEYEDDGRVIIKDDDPLTSHFAGNYFRKYTYDNATSYKGDIIDAWPPSRNRNVTVYLNYSFTTFPRKDKLTNKTLLVMVMSSPPDINLRQICRNTWGKHANKETSVLFLIGKNTNASEAIADKLLEEKRRYGDIIQVDGLIENYYNLTLKSLYALKFFTKKNIFISRAPQYMLKVDTDTIVNLPKLYHQLTNDNEVYKNIKLLLMGACFCCEGKTLLLNHCRRLSFSEFPAFIRKPGKHKRVVGHNRFKVVKSKVKTAELYPWLKWHSPDYLYNGKLYPSYLSGGSGYAVSRDAAKCMFTKALETPYFHLEDVYITGFVAQACGVKRLDNPGFVPYRKNFNYRTDIVVHQDCSLNPSMSTKCYTNIKINWGKNSRLLETNK